MRGARHSSRATRLDNTRGWRKLPTKYAHQNQFLAILRAMNTNGPTVVNPSDLIDSLDPKPLRARLEELDRQRSALRVLLRAALARQRKARSGNPSRQGKKQGEEEAD